MGFTTPRTWVAGETVTDTIMNTHVRDNLTYLGTGIIRLDVNTTAVGNVGAGEDDLMTYTLPASTLSVDGMGVRITAWGITANNANAKTVKMYFGSTNVGSLICTTNTIEGWVHQAVIIRTGATAQLGRLVLSAQAAVWKWGGNATAPTETLSGAVTIKCTGEATATNDIVQQLMLVELIR